LGFCEEFLLTTIWSDVDKVAAGRSPAALATLVTLVT
jgi:hypothetical protein